MRICAMEANLAMIKTQLCFQPLTRLFCFYTFHLTSTRRTVVGLDHANPDTTQRSSAISPAQLTGL